MERDFMGLNTKNDEEEEEDLVVTSHALKDNNTTAVFMRGSLMQWPLSNKVSALPQLMPFKTVNEERPKRTIFDPLSTSGFMPIATADAFDVNLKTFDGVVQKNISFDRQGANLYAMNTYPVQLVDAHSAHRPQNIKTYPVSNNAIAVTMSNPFFKTRVATSDHNFDTNPMMQQTLGGIPLTTPQSVFPVMRSMVGNTDQRNISLATPASAQQLTIFYGGSVSVYDDISPEKAQAIMYLAGNGSTLNANVTTSRTQVQAPSPMPVGGDGAHGNQSRSSPCSGLSSPISVTSHAFVQSASGSSRTDDLMSVKPIGNLTPPSSQSEPPKTVSGAPTLMPAAVPQARKASLARFLEKRKERVTNTTPYNMNKKSSEGSTTQGSNSIGLSGNPEIGNIPAKQQSWSLGPTQDEKSIERLQPTLGI